MLSNANVTKILDAPNDKFSAAIKSFDGFDRWFPIIISCHVEGAGVDAVRILGLAGGSEMRDRILEISGGKTLQI
jgi:hypothetical protein